MCFYHGDYDWVARVNDEEEGPAPAAVICDECHRRIRAGEWRYHLDQQEHEECQACEDGDCGCLPDSCCECVTPRYGETFTYDRCEHCHLMLAAIEAAEAEEGCDGDEARPSLGRMAEEVGDAGREARTRYADAARERSPGLAMSGYLDNWFDPDAWEDAQELDYDWDGHDFEPVEVYGGEG